MGYPLSNTLRQAPMPVSEAAMAEFYTRAFPIARTENLAIASFMVRPFSSKISPPQHSRTARTHSSRDSSKLGACKKREGVGFVVSSRRWINGCRTHLWLLAVASSCHSERSEESLILFAFFVLGRVEHTIRAHVTTAKYVTRATAEARSVGAAPFVAKGADFLNLQPVAATTRHAVSTS
jgi:hypothetical protein